MAEKLYIFKRLMIFCIIVWTILLLAFFINDIFQHKSYAFNLALHEARISVKKDLAYRTWVSSHGGVYPKNRSWNVARMNKVLKIKVFLDNFDFIRSHSTGEVKIFQKSLRLSALGIRSSFNCGF